MALPWETRESPCGKHLIALFLAVLTVERFLYVVHTGRVESNVLSAVLCVYLLLGGVFAFLYALVG